MPMLTVIDTALVGSNPHTRNPHTPIGHPEGGGGLNSVFAHTQDT